MTHNFDEHPEAFLCLVYLGAVFIVTSGVVETLVFRVMTSPRKRNWFHTLYPLFCCVPLILVYISTRPRSVHVILVTAFAAYYLFHAVRTPPYCESCGGKVYERWAPPMSGVSHCPHCGAPVKTLGLRTAGTRAARGAGPSPGAP